MTSTILTAEATVKLSGTPWTTKYGPKSKALVVLSSTGEEVQLWGNEHDAAILGLKAGQTIQLIQIKGKWKLATTQTQQATPNPSNGNTATQQNHYQPKPVALSNETKQEIATYVTEQANLLAFCIDQAHKSLVTRFPNESTPLESEMVRTAGITLYISVQKHFSL